MNVEHEESIETWHAANTQGRSINDEQSLFNLEQESIIINNNINQSAAGK